MPVPVPGTGPVPDPAMQRTPAPVPVLRVGPPPPRPARRGHPRNVPAAGPMRVAGTMSGTSLDGVDAAVLETDGITISGFGPSAFRPYPQAERAILRAALGSWPGAAQSEAAAQVVEAAHAALLPGLWEQGAAPGLVGFHGQTLAHEPRGRGTHQAGDGSRLAGLLGLPVVWDFRSADVALGGEGAPLAPFYHWALARHIGAQAPLAILNLGGVANLSWVDPAAPAPEVDGALLAFDTGPANAPIDDLIGARTGAARDEGGRLAAEGRVDARRIEDWLTRGYFARIPPKSLDRAEVAAFAAGLDDLSLQDAAATLAGLAAAAVAAGFAHLPAPPSRLLVAGGGRHNRGLMVALAARLPCPVAPVEAEGLDGDMIEAQAFGYLAVRVLRGMPTSCPGTTGVAAAVGGGQVSRP